MQTKKNNEPVFLTQEDYDKLALKIEQLKKAINKNNKGRKEAFDAGAGDGWDSPEFEEIERTARKLEGEIREYLDILSRAVISDKNDDDIIDIGDIIVLEIILSPEESKESLYKLVGIDPNFNAEIREISIHSPIGAAIYKKKIGETCTYVANGKELSVYIKEKQGLSKKDNNQLQRNRTNN